ncbi:zincin-like metallopeptidase domain-containing protein [Gallibacterium anatis]|uniref:ArdC family protein n=1 Tax=Gallibacterium anatis TaxID=750 RepID=UPI00300441C1
MKNQQNASHKIDVYQDVTDRIVQCLESGTRPWIKPWVSGLPQNAVSGRYYTGINVLLLMIASEEKGYQSTKWLTAKAANKLGGKIKKGEKATRIINYSPIEREKKDDNGELILDSEGNPEMEKFAIIRAYPLFNIEQCEGLPEEMYLEKEMPSEFQKVNEVHQILEGMGVAVKHTAGDQAYYSPLMDVINMPLMKTFCTERSYYSVLLHEMIHATGHKDRLEREGITSKKAKFGNEIYAFEELIAEMGSAFVCTALGFDTISNNASYIDSWIKVLKSDKKAIFRASGEARKAAEYLFEIRDTMRLYEQYEQYDAA